MSISILEKNLKVVKAHNRKSANRKKKQLYDFKMNLLGNVLTSTGETLLEIKQASVLSYIVEQFGNIRLNEKNHMSKVFKMENPQRWEGTLL